MDKEKKKRGAEKLREKQKMETDAAKCETLMETLIVRAAAPPPAVPPTLLTNPGGST